MLGKWFAQFIYYFTFFYLKHSNEFIFSSLKSSQNQNQISDEFSGL